MAPISSYLDNSEFDHTQSKGVGGLTGSKKVPLKNGQDYQLKPSIVDNSFMRKTKAGGMDRENFGEFISAAVGCAVMNTEGKTNLVPEVYLVHDKEHRKVKIASKYLEGVEGNLNDYAKKQDIKVKGRFVKVTTNPMPKGECLDLSGDNDDKKIQRQDLAKALAISAFSGDHDVNPGNMLALKDTNGKTRIARIDFGHAFNDLINAPKMFGGTLRNEENKILDFFNRDEIAHIKPNHRESKLWASYNGIIPSDELATALKEISESQNAKKGLDNAKAGFEKLMDVIINSEPKNPEANKKELDHIVNSLIAINNNVSENKLNAKKLSHKAAFNKVFDNLGKYYEQNQQQMKDVAKLVQMQADIDKVILAKKDGKEPDKELVQSVRTAYKELHDAPGIGLKDVNGDFNGIEWAKTTNGVPAFKGSLNHYMESRAKGFGVEIKGIEDLSTRPPIVVKDEYTLIATFLEKSVELYAKQTQPIDKKDLKQKFENLLLTTVTSHEKTEVMIALKDNMEHYVNHMDNEMKRLSNEVLSNYHAPKSEEILTQAMNTAVFDSSFHKASKALQEKGENWFDKSANTKWKKAEKLFDFIGMKETAKWCSKKNEKENLKTAAKAVGIPILRNIKAVGIPISKNIKAEGSSTNKKANVKASEYCH
jgi:hypothetical protein